VDRFPDARVAVDHGELGQGLSYLDLVVFAHQVETALLRDGPGEIQVQATCQFAD
jgi:hypothetical protein